MVVNLGCEECTTCLLPTCKRREPHRTARQHRARGPLSWHLAIAACAILISAVPVVAQTATRAPARRGRVPTMADGRPALEGTWTNNTATPLVRPADLAGKRHFTLEEAAEFERTWLDPWSRQSGKPLALAPT